MHQPLAERRDERVLARFSRQLELKLKLGPPDNMTYFTREGKQYALNLKAEASDALEEEAFHLVQSRARYIASRIRWQFDTTQRDHYAGIDQLQGQVTNKKPILERYLRGRMMADPEGLNESNLDLGDNDSNDLDPGLLIRLGSGAPLSNTPTATTPLTSHMPSHVLSHTNLVCTVRIDTTSYPIITARCRYSCIENLGVAFAMEPTALPTFQNLPAHLTAPARLAGESGEGRGKRKRKIAEDDGGV